MLRYTTAVPRPDLAGLHSFDITLEVPKMLIETTTNLPSKDDADDNLAGVKTLPGFLVGYARPRPDQTFDVITIFDCSGNTQTLRRQKPVMSLTFGDVDGGWFEDAADETEEEEPISDFVITPYHYKPI
jgi:hypothetical protein